MRKTAREDDQANLGKRRDRLPTGM